jgi:predicted nucleotidyltransferase
MIQSEKVEKVEKWLEQNNEIELAILFGSYAKGSQTSKSDLDLAIQLVSGSSISAKKKLHFIEQLANLLLVNVDLVDLQRTGQPLLSQIMKYGKRLKGGQTQYAELAIKNINTSQDFLPYIKRMMSERRIRCLSDG